MRGAPLLVPAVIVVGEPAERRHRLGLQVGTRRDIDAAVVHVAGDGMAVDDLPRRSGPCPWFSQPVRLIPHPVTVPDGLPFGVARRVVTHRAQEPGRLEISPVAIETSFADEIRPLRPGPARPSVGSTSDTFPVSMAALGASSENASFMPLRSIGGIAHLRVAQERHAAGSPVVDDVGERVDVHEQGVVLPAPNLSSSAQAFEQTDLRVASASAE